MNKIITFANLKLHDRFVFDYELSWNEWLTKHDLASAASVLPYIGQYIKMGDNEYIYEKTLVHNSRRGGKNKKIRGFTYEGAFVRKI